MNPSVGEGDVCLTPYPRVGKGGSVVGSETPLCGGEGDVVCNTLIAEETKIQTYLHTPFSLVETKFSQMGWGW